MERSPRIPIGDNGRQNFSGFFINNPSTFCLHVMANPNGSLSYVIVKWRSPLLQCCKRIGLVLAVEGNADDTLFRCETIILICNWEHRGRVACIGLLMGSSHYCDYGRFALKAPKSQDGASATAST